MLLPQQGLYNDFYTSAVRLDKKVQALFLSRNPLRRCRLKIYYERRCTDRWPFIHLNEGNDAGIKGLTFMGRHWFSRRERQLLTALLYLAQAEDGGIVDTSLSQCRNILLESLSKVAKRPINGKPGNVFWVLLARFKAAYESSKLSYEGWNIWLEASRDPADLMI
jgi:hypothetical protein